MSEEKDKEEFSFMKEKIKAKPINKKKLLLKVAGTVVLAVLFGVVASFTFVITSPIAEKKYGEKEEIPSVTIPRDDEAAQNPEPEATPTPVPAPSNPPAVIQQTVGIEVEDYRKLYNKLYEVAAGLDKALVTVTAVSSNVDWFNVPYTNQGKGSGVIVAENGIEYMILTDERVLEGAEQIMVTFANDTQVEATVKKIDHNTEIAILSVRMDTLEEDTRNAVEVAVLGNSFQVRKGTPVIAIGSPLGYPDSMSIGMVTSAGNHIATWDANYTMFTTDILGNADGSGVLINLDGDVIGVITQESNDNSSENVVTAYSVSELKSVIEHLSNGLDLAYMGIKGTPVTDEKAEENGMPQGIYIVETALDSPAMNVGIQNGDILVKLGTEEVKDMKDVQNVLLNLSPNQLVTAVVMRPGKDGYKELTYQVTLGVRE
ncbi:S1C family serine protease [Diplocloster agilis]|uniref:Trypsin-like peptidase domain-containing protein n=1 Tax=Diplocloster agilis TaxID=2850323 RepID=A0A949JVW1_9FIRM|nr:MULTISPECIES: S1C family serine protease [Lachnospiraceae]MBU9736115.1 trypsin-like peptidase domain-containing protein [Diplocloster agilis]MBU9744977.1 trypsin-like peptidase domain-containing protein [Diplocloster agilis]MCU6732130.1 trypsin-like peptidase domain-containing protein [Suonthocola fibrivorans]SCI34506.1 Putative serine protease HhoB precursor [uncultured Clostridium sp.]